ncbi:unnamed protein product [Caenorhabditis auriculariae]|uniref:VOC domain-containing protein n=1 Tax=Caenorhabditis auriculariae TaxID=2777116 RepID=A0A8S1HNI3_9PELO|nr:unnamed protein product [Caenorhabditis auriculariae]
MAARALHYVFKIGDRKKTYDFYTQVLMMKVLRHEEFDKGCAATCNGPYDGSWSKTMIGYGAEDDNFVIELTYNYPISHYKLGNDFRAIVIEYDKLYEKILAGDHRKTGCGRLAVTDPDGHVFKIGKSCSTPTIERVQVNVSDLTASRNYWSGLLDMKIIEEKENRVVMQFAVNQCKWEIVESKESMDRGTAFGRIAFAYPDDQLKQLQDKMKSEGKKILNELVTLETPGKADVKVVILADPDEHEICFVGEKGFRDLSKVDEKADTTIKEAMEKDDSHNWYDKTS